MYSLQEGPSNICVFGEDIRTTASLEAYNNHLGDIMAKKGHFFRFAVALNKQEHAKSLELEMYISSGGLTGYRRKRTYKVTKYSCTSFDHNFNYENESLVGS